jgi:cysteinyl-tRNA synthetase
MEIKLHNTLSGEKETFAPIKEGEVKMYNCGPTVYDFAHIGNFRTFIMADLLRRTFEYEGYKVMHVMNITDVDDKTIKKSKQEKAPLKTVTSRYEKLFFEDLKALNILLPNVTPRATENIQKMIELIERLLDKGAAYTSSDGVYFDISKAENYGELARLDLSTKTKERIANDEYDKENARDFSLWKFYTEADGDVFYEAPFGKGRPGWHIECSAMSMNELGETIDIHAGGSDLIFPHHTNEIAQSEAATGKKFVDYWVHGGFITVDGKKMSKSLGNVFTLADLRSREIHPLSFRYLCLSTKYSSLMNFTWEAVQGAQVALEKIVNEYQQAANSENTSSEILSEFANAICDDLNMPVAVSLLHEAKLRKEIDEMDKVLGLNIKKLAEEIQKVPSEIKDLQKQRDEARKSNDWKLSDELRDKIEVAGYVVKDSVLGTIILNTLSNLAKSL